MKTDFSREFDGNTDDELRLENDLLKLKMQAEMGAHFGSFHGEELPPEIEKQFLEQVMAFHKNLEENPPLPLRDYLGNPDFPHSSTLSESALQDEWERICSLYEEKQLRVDFLAEYPLALKYDFMAIELMDEEIDPPALEGQTLCFIYEEAHPNNDFDQRAITEDFMTEFFTGSFDEDCLSPVLITEQSSITELAKAQELLDRFHGMFDSIKDWDFRIGNTSAQTDEEMGESMSRLGFTEGLIRYVAVSHDGSEQEITGPFKLYMECGWGCWCIMHFHMHGFSWALPETDDEAVPLPH